MSRYELLDKIGEGGMGVVFRARQIDLARDVAIKFLSDTVAASRPDQVRRFRREMEILIGLSHPNIVRIFDGGTRDDRLYFVMELLVADDLARYIGENRLVPLPTFCSIVDQLLDALGYLHGQGIVHRDLKPSNVMVDGSGRVVLTDFGLARNPELTAITSVGQVTGTPRYMPPEVLEGSAFTPSSDLWCLGATIYELLCGEMAFDQKTIPEVLRAILSQDPPLVSTRREGLPFEVTAFVHRFLEKNPAHRWASADEAREALGQIRSPAPRTLADEPHPVPAPVPGPSPDRGSARPVAAPWRAAIVLVLIVLVSVLALHRTARLDVPHGGDQAASGAARPDIRVERSSVDRLVIEAPTPPGELVSRLARAVEDRARLVADRTTDDVFRQVVLGLRGWDRQLNGSLRPLLERQPETLAPYEALVRRLTTAGEPAASLDAIRPLVGSILRSPSTPAGTVRALLAALWPLDQVDGLASVLRRRPPFDVEGALTGAVERQVTSRLPAGSWRKLFPDAGRPRVVVVARDEFAGALAGGLFSGAYALELGDGSHLVEGSRIVFADRAPGAPDRRQLAFRVSYHDPLSYLKVTCADTGASLPVRQPNGLGEPYDHERWIIVTLRGTLAASRRWTLEHARISRDTWRPYFIAEQILTREIE